MKLKGQKLYATRLIKKVKRTKNRFKRNIKIPMYKNKQKKATNKLKIEPSALLLSCIIYANAEAY